MAAKLAWMGPRQSSLALLLGVVAIAAVGAASIRSGDLILYNHSPSIAVGFYLRTNGTLSRGAVVTLRAEDAAPAYARVREFTDEGDRFIKRIAALEGDVVCAEGGAIQINGRTVARRAVRDSTGRALPTWSGCRVLTRDEVFLLGDTPDSFDGRYFGVVETSNIEGVWSRVGFCRPRSR